MSEIIYFENTLKTKSKIAMIYSFIETAINYNAQHFVLVITGDVLTNPVLLDAFAKDVVLLKSIGVNVTIIFNPFEKIKEWAKKFNVEINLSENNNIKDSKSCELLEMHASYMSSQIVNNIIKHDGHALSMTGKDAKCVEALRYKKSKEKDSKIENITNQMFEGEISKVNQEYFMMIEDSGYVPVIAPIAYGKQGESVHIDFLVFAGEIANCIGTNKFIFISDNNALVDDKGQVVKSISQSQLELHYSEYVKNWSFDLKKNTLSILQMLKFDIAEAYMLSGKVEHNLLLSLLSSEIHGTIIKG